LMQALERELVRRSFGPAVRLEVETDNDEAVLTLMMREIEITPDDVFQVDGLIDLSSMHQVYDVDRPKLKDRPFVPATHPRFAEGETPKSVFATLREGDVLVHHP
ncbi:MAG: polyphosphate kinase, partial [Arthrobacter sp.]|nr:polyphosphate kinase [Arthrobacter sp.]